MEAGVMTFVTHCTPLTHILVPLKEIQQFTPHFFVTGMLVISSILLPLSYTEK